MTDDLDLLALVKTIRYRVDKLRQARAQRPDPRADAIVAELEKTVQTLEQLTEPQGGDHGD